MGLSCRRLPRPAETVNDFVLTLMNTSSFPLLTSLMSTHTSHMTASRESPPFHLSGLNTRTGVLLRVTMASRARGRHACLAVTQNRWFHQETEPVANV